VHLHTSPPGLRADRRRDLLKRSGPLLSTRSTLTSTARWSRSISTTGEGELLKRVRAVVGPDMKIAVSVDSHANMTAEMFALANVIAAYRTYPHVDMADTGRRAAEMLLHVVDTKAVVHFAVAPTALSHSCQRHVTMMHPARGVYDALEALEKDVLLLSFAPGFPASDFSQCGPTVWGYGHDPKKLEHAVEALLFKNTGGRAGMVGGIRRAICSSAAGRYRSPGNLTSRSSLPIRRTIPA